MRITWDKKACAVYIYLDVESKEHGHTKELDDSVFLDYDTGNTLYGIEVLNTQEPEIENLI